MSQTALEVERKDTQDRIWTVVCGWLAVVLLVIGLHWWVEEGSISWWNRMMLVAGVFCLVNWLWGHGPRIWSSLRAWAARGGLNTFLIALLLIASLIVVNILARRRFPASWDLTKNKRYTLAPRSKQILDQLDQPVKATVFIPKGRSTTRTAELFEMYEQASPRFQWTRVDPLTDQKTLLAKRPKLDRSSFEGAVLEYGDGKREDLTSFSEKEISGAILKLTRPLKRKLQFLKGHGEADPDGFGDNGIQGIVRDLKDLGWSIETVDLYPKDAAAPDPTTVATLVIAGARREITTGERQKINAYLNKGGRVLMLLDVESPTQAAFLKEWGISSPDEVVVGDDATGGLLRVFATDSSHEAVRTAQPLVMQPARSLKSATPAPTGVTVTELLGSGGGSQVAGGYKIGKPLPRSALKPGPTGIVMMAEKSIGTGDSAKTARVIVTGDSAWFTDRWTSLPFANVAVGSGLINYLGEEEALVAIPPKDENTEQAFLTPAQGRMLLLIHFLDFPLLALILAVAVYLKRR